MKRSKFGLFLWAAALVAFAQPSGKLGVGDNIRVTVFQQPDLTTETRITESGTIAMPLVGEVKIAGLSTIDAANRIAGELKEGKFLRNPQVSVAVMTVRTPEGDSYLGPGAFTPQDAAELLRLEPAH